MLRLHDEAFLRLVRGQTHGIFASVARVGLGIAASGYSLAVAYRNWGYDRGRRPVSQAGVPVVSVGNLTLGGTGKTPMVEWVARWYRAHDVRVAILSRGYRRGGDAGVNDEAMVLEQNLPDVPHLQDPDRVAIAGVAVEELESQLLILDDGFQHRRLARDLDLVLLDALEPFGLGRIFPRGLLREPISSLRRATVVVISRADLVDDSKLLAIEAEAARNAGPLRFVRTRHAPRDLIGTGVEPASIASLKDRAVAAFCGIGNPEGFLRTITPHCDRVVGFRRFPDHHAYDANDVADLSKWVRETGADLVLTTQKDLVKLRTASLGSTPLRALRIGLEILSGVEILEDSLSTLLRNDRPAAPVD